VRASSTKGAVDADGLADLPLVYDTQTCTYAYGQEPKIFQIQQSISGGV